MAYTPYDYTAIAGTSNPLTNLQSMESNMNAVLDALMTGALMPGWDMKVYEPAGTYPPADPAHIAERELTLKENTQIKVRATLTWSGDTVTSAVLEKTTNGGTSWDPMGDTGYPLGKVTYTFSAVAGFTDFIIEAIWS